MRGSFGLCCSSGNIHGASHDCFCLYVKKQEHIQMTPELKHHFSKAKCWDVCDTESRPDETESLYNDEKLISFTCKIHTNTCTYILVQMHANSWWWQVTSRVTTKCEVNEVCVCVSPKQPGYHVWLGALTGQGSHRCLSSTPPPLFLSLLPLCVKYIYSTCVLKYSSKPGSHGCKFDITSIYFHSATQWRDLLCTAFI